MFDTSVLPHDVSVYVMLYAVLLFFGVSKGGFGGGLGVLAVPMLIYVMPALEAIGVMLPILCLMDVFAIAAYWRKYDAVNMRLMLPACVAGIIAGSMLVGFLDGNLIKLLVGAFALFFTVSYFLQRKIRKQQEFRHSRLKAGFWGVAAGIGSTIAHAGGPPANFYLLPQKMDKVVFVGTTVHIFTFLNFAKLVPYTYLGLINPASLTISLIALPAAPAGIYLGVRLRDKLNPRTFYFICYAALFLTGLKLVSDSLLLYLPFE